MNCDCIKTGDWIFNVHTKKALRVAAIVYRDAANVGMNAIECVKLDEAKVELHERIAELRKELAEAEEKARV